MCVCVYQPVWHYDSHMKLCRGNHYRFLRTWTDNEGGKVLFSRDEITMRVEFEVVIENPSIFDATFWPNVRILFALPILLLLFMRAI